VLGRRCALKLSFFPFDFFVLIVSKFFETAPSMRPGGRLIFPLERLRDIRLFSFFLARELSFRAQTPKSFSPWLKWSFSHFSCRRYGGDLSPPPSLSFHPDRCFPPNDISFLLAYKSPLLLKERRPLCVAIYLVGTESSREVLPPFPRINVLSTTSVLMSHQNV